MVMTDYLVRLIPPDNLAHLFPAPQAGGDLHPGSLVDLGEFGSQRADRAAAAALQLLLMPDEEIPQTFEFSQMQLPQELPLSLPSRLVGQRPDVRQAEENLHAASAQVGIAVANRLPNITLTGSIGANSLSPGQLFQGGSEFWGLGAGLRSLIFQPANCRFNFYAQRLQCCVFTE